MSLELERHEEPEGFKEWRKKFQTKNRKLLTFEWIKEIDKTDRPPEAMTLKDLRYFVLREIYDAESFEPVKFKKKNIPGLQKAIEESIKEAKKTGNKEDLDSRLYALSRVKTMTAQYGNLQGPLLFPEKKDQKRSKPNKKQAIDGLIYGLARKFYWYTSCLPLSADISQISEFKPRNLPLEMRPRQSGYTEYKAQNEPRPKMNSSICDIVNLVFGSNKDHTQIAERLYYLRKAGVFYVGWPCYWIDFFTKNLSMKKLNQKELDQIVFKTGLGRISLRQCKKSYQLVFRTEMPDRMAYINALGAAIEKAGERKVVNIIRAIDRIDGPIELIDGWEN